MPQGTELGAGVQELAGLALPGGPAPPRAQVCVSRGCYGPAPEALLHHSALLCALAVPCLPSALGTASSWAGTCHVMGCPLSDVPKCSQPHKSTSLAAMDLGLSGPSAPLLGLFADAEMAHI